MTLTLFKSPSTDGFTHTGILFKPYSRVNLKVRSFLSEIVSICSCSLYLFFCLAPKGNNSLATDKELFPPGQNAGSLGSNTSTPKQYSFAPGSNCFAPFTYSSAPGRHVAAPRWQTSTSGSDALTPLRYSFTPGRHHLTPRSGTLASLRYCSTPGRQRPASGSGTFTPLKYQLASLHKSLFAQSIMSNPKKRKLCQITFLSATPSLTCGRKT